MLAKGAPGKYGIDSVVDLNSPYSFFKWVAELLLLGRWDGPLKLFQQIAFNPNEYTGNVLEASDE